MMRTIESARNLPLVRSCFLIAFHTMDDTAAVAIPARKQVSLSAVSMGIVENDFLMVSGTLY